MRLDAIGIGADVDINAPNASAAFDFPVPRLAKLQSATAYVSVTPGEQLHSNSLFFFYFNDKLVATRTARDLRQQKQIVLQLPVDGKYRESVQLQVKTHMFMTEDLCRDYNTGGMFFTIHRATFLSLDYDMLPVRTVADFFGSFQQALLLVVPDQASLAEVAPAAWVYGMLKKNYPTLDIQLVNGGDLAKLPPVPRIWIGMTEKLPSYFKNTLPGISLVDPNTLLISAADVRELQDNARQLADLPAFFLNPSSSQRIKVTPVETVYGSNAKSAVPFGSNNSQEGIQLVPSLIPLFPAMLETVPGRLGLHIEGAYSVVGEGERPVRMDVFLNNNLVHSSSLNQTGTVKKDVLLPESVELLARNVLNVQFVYPESQGQCRVRGQTQTTQIATSSYMWGEDRYPDDRFVWPNIGMFFGKKGTILLDTALGSSTLKIAGELVYFLNTQLPPGFVAFPDLAELSAQAEFPGGSFLLVAGMAENIPQKIQERMPVSLGQNFTLYRKNSRNVMFEYQNEVKSVVGRVGAMNGAPLVAFTANLDGALLVEALKYLVSFQRYDQLNGNILIYQQPQRLHSMDLRDRTLRIEQEAPPGSLREFWLQNRPLILMAAGMLTLFILVSLLIQQILARRKGEEHPVRDEKKFTPFK